jgi:hypothetical protein
MITHVAIRFRGRTWALPAPNRHRHVRSMIMAKTGAEAVDVPPYDEGFLDEHGNYYGRRQALVHALNWNQVKDESKVRADMLTSEDVW